MNKFAIAAAALAAGFTVSPALAQPVQVEVSFADLDVATQEGASRLADRIASNVKAACAPNESRLLKVNAAAEACVATMRDNAVAQLNSKGASLAAEALATQI